MYENRSFQDKLFAAQACQKVEELKARHAYLHATGNSREEYDIFWLKSGHTTFAHGFGRMCGYEQEVGFNSITHTDKMFILGNFNAINKFPELEGHDLRNTASNACHALASSVIEIAENGKSARSFYSTPGVLMGSVGFDNKHRGGNWLWERYGSDFVYVDGEWLWFHEQVCPDFGGVYDVGNWAYDAFQAHLSGKGLGPEIPMGDDDTEFRPAGGPARLGEPGRLHNDYSMVQTIQNTVPLPKKYEYLGGENSYSPERNDPYAVDNARVASSRY